MEQRADEVVGGAFFGVMAVAGVIGALVGYWTGGIGGVAALGGFLACVIGRSSIRG